MPLTFRLLLAALALVGCTDAAGISGSDVDLSDAPDVGADAAPDLVDDPADTDSDAVGPPDIGPDAVDAVDAVDAPDTETPDVPPACEPQPEVCDGLDNDCDELVDEADDGTPLTASDIKHCGACDDPCALGEASGRCVAGVCLVDACADGFLDLDGVGRNGCETELGEVHTWQLEKGNVERLVDGDPWYFVLDGRVVWMHLAGTGELVDHVVLPGAYDAAWDAGRSLLVVAGQESVSVLSVGDAGLTARGFLAAPRDELRRVVVSGDYAYVANEYNRNGDSRLWVVNIADPSRPFVAHREGTLRGTTDVALLDADHLVTVSSSIGLAVYSLANPEHPFLLSFTGYRTWPSSALAIDRDRRRAYVAIDRSTIDIFDLSDPEAVSRLGSITDRTPNQSALGLLVDGDDLWTTDLVRVRRFDVRDPANPVRQLLQDERGAGPLTRLGGRPAMVVYDGYGNTLSEYSVTSARIMEVTLQPSRATLGATLLYAGEDRYGVERAFALGRTLLTVSQAGEMTLYAPEEADGILPLGPSLWRSYTGVFDVVVEGDQVIGVTGAQNGDYYNESDLVVWRLMDPAQGLVEVGRGTFPCGVNGIVPYDLTVAGDMAFVMCGSWSDRRIESLDLSEELSPRYVGSLATQVGAFHATATRDQLVIGSQRQVLNRTAVQFSGYPRPVIDTATPSWRHDPSVVPTDVRLHGSVLYLWDDRGELDLLDIGFRDGFSPVEGPALPGAPIASDDAPPVSGPYLVMPTTAGVVVVGEPDGRNGPTTAPRVLGRLTNTATPLSGAAILPQGAVLLEPRRTLTVPFR